MNLGIVLIASALLALVVGGALVLVQGKEQTNRRRALMFATAVAFVALIISGILVWITYSRTGGAIEDPSKVMGETYKTVGIKPSPLVCQAGGATRLCDHKITGSAYSYMAGRSVIGVPTENAIEKVIQAGARIIELHVYDKDGSPEVGIADSITGEQYTPINISFEKCCQVVANNAFSSTSTPVYSDPFIVSVVFHTENTNIMNACADIMKSTVRKFMLGNEYSHVGKPIEKSDICKELLNKLIIVSGKKVEGTDFGELTNIYYDGPTMRRLTYKQAIQTYDKNELIDFNRNNITMVIPDGSVSLENKNTDMLYNVLGCQWVLVNYGSTDKNMSAHLSNFLDFSVKPKSDELLPKKPPSFVAPPPPDPALSAQPRRAKTALYDITI